jgi:hypothetical protein
MRYPCSYTGCWNDDAGENIGDRRWPVKIKLFFIVPLVLLCGCQERQPKTETKTVTQDTVAETKTAQQTFNFNDKNIGTNGNVLVAMSLLNGIQPESTVAIAKKITAETVTKSPYSTIGKLISIPAKIYKIEELPGSSGYKGQWTEILCTTPNRNSSLGFSSIDFIVYGTNAPLNSGDKIWCTGYFVGTYESSNMYGGKVEALMIIGNAVKLSAPRHPTNDE